MAGETTGAPSAPAAAPSAPAAAPAQQQSSRGRVSSFEQAMEAKNAAQGARERAAPPFQRQQSPAQEQLQARQQQQRPAEQQAPQAPVAQQQQLEEDGEIGAPEEQETADQEPEQPEEQQLETEPEPSADGLPDDASLAAMMREWLSTGAAPAMIDKLSVDYVDANGNHVTNTIGELKKGGMRLSDYHRGMQQQKQVLEGVARRDGNVREHFQKINDPPVFLQEYEDRGYGPVLDKVYELIHQRKKQENMVIEAAGYRVMQEEQVDSRHPHVINAMRACKAQLEAGRQAQSENRRMKREHEQLLQQRQFEQQRTEVGHNQERFAKSLDHLVPMGLKAQRIYNSPANQQALYRNLVGYVQTIPNWDGQVTRAHVLAAARITREELEDARAARAGQKTLRQQPAPANGQRKQLPAQVRRALPPGGAARSGTAQPAGSGRKRPSDFETQFFP